MNKANFFLAGILFCIINLFTCWLTLYAQEVNFSIVSQTSESVIVKVDFPQYQVYTIDVKGKKMSKLIMKNAYPIEEAGTPELLKSATSILIPEGSHPTVSIIKSSYEIVPDFELVPSKGRLYRNVNPDDIPYTMGEQYRYNGFLYDQKVTLGTPFYLRDFYGLTLQCYPFDYHPVKKDLKVYKTMLIKIDFNSTQRITSSQKLTSEFEKIAQNFFLNYPADRYDVMPEEGEMLIITPDIFAEALQPLADWKIKNGMQTTIVPLSVTGNSSNAIKSYITTFYHQHNLAFVLIVGDNQYFPTFIIDGKSCDNYYAEIAGNDNLPDIMLGKLSAETVEHVNIQVQKFIDYEKNPAETAHFSKFCGIASSEGPGDNNEYDYQHIRNIDNRLQAFTYTSGYELFAGNQGGLDAVGSPTSSMLTNVLNDGVGVLNYCGHGSDNGFVTTGFSSSHIATLNNYNKLPFIFAVACVNGNYVEQTCFAEAWLRAAKDGQPTGAVTTVMSTMNQPWNPPMCAQDEMNSLMTETYTHNIKRTFGGIVFNSLLKMMEVYDDELTMRTWITFGDPSLMVRTAVPSTLQVTHQTMLPLGVTEIQISSPMEGAKVALSVGHQIIAQGIIQNGVVLLPVQDLTPDDTLTVLASCFNYVPYQGSITFYTTNEPYLIYKSHTLHDSMGNNNGRLEYNEEAQLTLCIKNAGNVRADSIQMILATQDPYITLLDSTEFALVADSFATICLQDAFSIRVANDAPNQHRVNFVLKLFYSDTVFVRNFYQSIDAPVLSLGTCFINDSASTDFNGRLDYQESAILSFDLKNIGGALSPTGMVSLQSLDQHLIISQLSQSVGALNMQGNGVADFNVTVASTVSEPTEAQVRIQYTAGQYSVTKDYTLKIAYLIEDWENENFETFTWVNDASHPWVITDENPYEGHFAARSGNITHSQSSSLSLQVIANEDDSVSFYYFVSCEQGFSGVHYDKLEFFIDNVLQETWDGSIGWSLAAFPLLEGNHILKWSYSKDYMVSDGLDLAMIDFIKFPKAIKSGIDHAQKQSIQLSVYPNPTTDMVYLQFVDVQPEGISYQLFDIYGKLISVQSIRSTHTVVPMQNLSSGIYLLKINSGVGNEQVVKIIKN